MVRVIVAGCAGRMGRRITTLGLSHSQCMVVGVFEQKGNPAVGHDIGEILGMGKTNLIVAPSLAEIIGRGDVIIDFTSPEATIEHMRFAVRARKKMVIVTTGLAARELRHIKMAARHIPIVCAPNMSVGVNLLFKLSRMVASVLDDTYDIEIVEVHHKFKKDAPSGTALELGRQVAAGRQVSFDQHVVYGRHGMCGERKNGMIGIHAVRGGDVVGDHTVSFLTEGERIELVHRASSRDAFARGALIAASFLRKKSKGLYSMQDVLGIA